MTRSYILKFFVFILVLKLGSSARILASIFIPSYSHQLPFRPLWKELAKRGHEITLLTTEPIKDLSSENIKQIDLSGSYQVLEEFNTLKNIATEKTATLEFLNNVNKHFEAIDVTIDWQLSQPAVMELIRNGSGNFDVLIVEVMNPIHMAFADKFKIPFIGVTSMDCPLRIHAVIGNYMHPVIYPDHYLTFDYPLDFTERVFSTLFNYYCWYFQYYIQYPKETEIARKHFGNELRDLQEIEKDISLLMVNVNPVIQRTRPTGMNTIFFGEGLHIEPPKALPEELQRFLDDSKEGVIYFSLGTNMKAAFMNEKKYNAILTTLTKLPYKILWKSVENIENLSTNIKIMKWVPQQDVLGHPNVKLFITQCGLQSLEEAIYKNVPLLAIPFLWDQHFNAQVVKQKEIGLYLNQANITEETLGNSIKEIIENTKYKTNIENLAKLSKDLELSGLDRAVWWIEYCIRTKGAKHFKSPSLDFPLYQFYMVDVMAFVLFLLLFPFLVLFVLVKCFICYFARKRKIYKSKCD